MRYAIFTDIHANLEALEAVLAKIDEISKQEPIDQIWFLGDLVGYGPNPNECIKKLRERTNVIIAGNHDWAAVGKIDLEDFSEAARISAEWTAEQLTEEHRTFLMNLPERLEIGDCLLVHGSPYGPLWEYLTSEVLAERSFQYFSNRYCFVGHTHVPVIFQQPDTVANAPTIPLDLTELQEEIDDVETEDETTEPLENADVETEDELAEHENGVLNQSEQENSDENTEEASLQALTVRSTLQTVQAAIQSDTVHEEPEKLQDIVTNAADVVAEIQQHLADDAHGLEPADPAKIDEIMAIDKEAQGSPDEQTETASQPETEPIPSPVADGNESQPVPDTITPESTIQNAEERLNEEIEELLALLGLSQSMISVTNEMVIPPEGHWQAPAGYRAIVNPGGVGQPRDGDARAAFMIYDTKAGFTFYRIPYSYEKTQEKIIKAKLPQYLATRLAYGR